MFERAAHIILDKKKKDNFNSPPLSLHVYIKLLKEKVYSPPNINKRGEEISNHAYSYVSVYCTFSGHK